MGVERFGDWDKARARLGNQLGVRLAKAIQEATRKNALMLRREIVKGIRSQSPGGKPFIELAPSTIKRKGSSKALIDTGFLINKITERLMGDKAFIGLLRGSTNQDGEDLANIGAIMEFGATIEQPNGVVVVIPARPFLHPVLVNKGDEIIQNYQKAIRLVLSE